MRKINNYFILPKFQTKLIIASVLPIVFVLGVLFYKFQASFDTLEKLMVNSGLHRNPQVLDAVQSQEIILYRYFYVGAGVGIILTLLSVIITSHKLAGPIYRLKIELKNRRKAYNAKELHFRKGDYLTEIEDDLNYFLINKEEEKKAS